MSQDAKPQNTSSEEIDLGQLFRLIGNAFQRFFNFIGSIFKGIFKILILFLIFIQSHIIKFAIATIIGLAVGFYLDYTKESVYESSMVVEPNFNSAQQLYNNIYFYDELADSEDSIALAQALSISIADAATIKEVIVESFSDENQKIKLFDDFIRQLDTNTIKTIDFKAYIENFNSFDARFHKITMKTTNNMVAKKTQKSIVKSISANEYFKLQKEVSDHNLSIQDSIYRKQLVEIDSLQNLYKEVMRMAAQNPNLGTNINLAEEKSQENRELELIKQIDVLKQNLVRLNEEKANKATIVNIISDFPARGVEVKGFFKSFKFWIPIGLISTLLLSLLLIELNKYLNTFKNKSQK